MNITNNHPYESKFKYLLFPAVIICFLVWLVPFFYQVYISLHDYNLNEPTNINEPVGLSNYKESIVNDQFFIKSVLRTIKLTSLCLCIEILLGLICALILYELNEKYVNHILSLIIIPMVIAPSVVGLIWYFQFNPDFGPLSIYLNKLRLLDQAFLGKDLAFFSVSFVDVWEYTPFMILVFYSALRSIPKSIKDSLYLDNVSYFFKFRKIYLAYILPIFIIAIFIRGTGLLKIFDQIYILTGGGPGEITEMFSLYAQRLNYKEFNFGLGSSQGVLMNYFFLMIFLVVYKKVKVY